MSTLGKILQYVLFSKIVLRAYVLNVRYEHEVARSHLADRADKEIHVSLTGQ